MEDTLFFTIKNGGVGGIDLSTSTEERRGGSVLAPRGSLWAVQTQCGGSRSGLLRGTGECLNPMSQFSGGRWQHITRGACLGLKPWLGVWVAFFNMAHCISVSLTRWCFRAFICHNFLFSFPTWSFTYLCFKAEASFWARGTLKFKKCSPRFQIPN